MPLLLDVVSWAFLAAGSFFAVVGGIGILRLPDFYSRMHGGSVTEAIEQRVRSLAAALKQGIRERIAAAFFHTPLEPDVFGLTFDDEGNLHVTTDCNTMNGRYLVDEHRIQFEQMTSTRMFCQGSQEQEFAKMLDSVSSYLFTDRGQLVLEIRYDSGSMIFR